MKHIKIFEKVLNESKIEELEKIKSIALKNTVPTASSKGILEAFYILKGAIIELETRLKELELHAHNTDDEM